MEKKMTYSQALATVINGEVITEEVMERLIALKASVDKKSGAKRKPSDKQVANEDARVAILDWMESGKAYTIDKMMEECEAVMGLSNQKISGILKPLKDDGVITREVIKGKVYYSLAE